MPTWLHPSRIATAFLVTLGLLGLIVVERQKPGRCRSWTATCWPWLPSRPGINGMPGTTDFLSPGGVAPASGGRGSGNNAMVDGI